MIAQFNNFSIKMTMKQAMSASHPGNCLAEVRILTETPAIKRQLKKISDADLILELSEYGAWDRYDLKNRTDNEERIVWIAACDITEENRQPAHTKEVKDGNYF